MKLFKLIATCVMATLLVISITLNILLLCGFEFTRAKTESSPNLQTDVVTSETQTKPTDKYKDKQTEISNNQATSSKDDYKTYEAETHGVLYEDNNVKVTYDHSVEETYGYVHKIKIENKSTKTLNVLFTDVHINGQEVFTSGLTCEKLLPGTSSIEDFVVLDKDWEHFTNAPTNLTFKVKLTNAKSYLDLYESDTITFIG